MKVNKTAIICLGVFAFITIFNLINHVPWYDEAHAWTIAEQLNFLDMFNYVKNEGHFFLWQALLYPFAHSNVIPYPYPMQALNWIFCFLALVLMWWKAPFNNFIKALITFSFPFLGCYSIVARCYSIGILLLFILTAFFDKKNKYPKSYALFLVLCANTSVIALIGAVAFGILFIFDLFKQKLSVKNNIIVCTELLIGVFLISYQLLKINYWEQLVGYKLSTLQINFQVFANSFVYSNYIINLILLFIFAVPVMLYFFKNKSAMFFLLFSFSAMMVLSMFFYELHFWHSYFFFIYLIISFWLCTSDDDIKKTVAICVLGLISFWLIFHVPHKKDFEIVYKTNILKIFSEIKDDKELTSAKIIHNCPIFYEFLPYAKDKKIHITSYCNTTDKSYNLSEHVGFECVRNDFFGQVQKNPDIIKEITDKNTYAYVNKDKYPNINKNVVVFADGYVLNISKYKCFGKHCFWKVEVK